MKCQQPSYHDKMMWCRQRVYGRVSPGSVWSDACYHHYHRAARKGWLVQR